jgi:hypothetical protein
LSLAMTNNIKIISVTPDVYKTTNTEIEILLTPTKL